MMIVKITLWLARKSKRFNSLLESVIAQYFNERGLDYVTFQEKQKIELEILCKNDLAKSIEAPNIFPQPL